MLYRSVCGAVHRRSTYDSVALIEQIVRTTRPGSHDNAVRGFRLEDFILEVM